jgi:hypothetical protein
VTDPAYTTFHKAAQPTETKKFPVLVRRQAISNSHIGAHGNSCNCNKQQETPNSRAFSTSKIVRESALPRISRCCVIAQTKQHEDEMMTKAKPLFVWIPGDLRAELEPVAAAERRSLRNTVCVALCEWLENRSKGRRDWRRGHAAIVRAARVRRPSQRSQELST